jgi:hypothetical protein
VLLYAGTCFKCRCLSAVVVALSLGRVARVPLDRPQWARLYGGEFARAKGSPILFHSGRAYYGLPLYLLTPVVALASALRALRDVCAGAWRGVPGLSEQRLRRRPPCAN